MERNEIKGYIIKQKEGGMREKEIVEELLKQGRQKKEIDDVLLDMDLSSFGPEMEMDEKRVIKKEELPVNKINENTVLLFAISSPLIFFWFIMVVGRYYVYIFYFV